MRDNYKELEYDPIKEARRYVDNARTALRDNGKLNVELNQYEDPKYVKAAGHYLWSGVLVVLDGVFPVKVEKGTRVSINDYRKLMANRDRKLLGLVNSAYNILHLDMGYDGVQGKEVCELGFSLANQIIDRCALLMAS